MEEKKNILVIYYSQTGQALEIAKSVLSCFNESENVTITYKPIKPVPDYPFPWTIDQFFDVFPESVGLKTCTTEKLELDNNINYDLIILAGQIWYLSPSIPISSFLQTNEAVKILKGKPIITIYGVRNMWVFAHKKTKMLINNAGGNIKGNIVLSDKANNLVSVITIVRWLIKGKKQAQGIWPEAGVLPKALKEAEKFGKPIKDVLEGEIQIDNLQNELLKLGAVNLNYATMKTELNGGRIFNIWYKKILQEGNLSVKKRTRRLKLFKYYLYFVIFGVSPFAALFFNIKKMILPAKTNKEIIKYSK